jgi:uncharacterized protein YggE
MRKILVIAGLAAGALAVAALAGVGLPEQAHGEAGVVRTITVNGAGTVKARPDRAQFSFGVESRAATARAASAENAAAMRRLIDALKDAGVSADHLQTEQVSVWPASDSDGHVTGYTAAGSVRVETTIDEAGPTVDAATAAGVTSVSGPSLTRSESHVLEEQALERALDDARRKAKALAGAAGAQLGEVVKVVEGGAFEPIPYERAALAKDAATPIEPGTVDTTAALTVTFAMG